MTKKTIGIYSNSSMNKKQDILKKDNIKKNTEYTGLLDKITMIDDITANVPKNRKTNRFIYLI